MDARFDELLERSGWVRQLARQLATDAHQADDLVQDAWVAALTRPPERGSSLRGWFARVLRNRAVEERRSAGNRRGRELEAAPGGPEPSTDELVERLDLQREIADAVRELDEPYRGAILLRYFEGLTPKEIARRTGEPVRTVHSRLNRGLGLLRRRLEPRGERARGVWLAGLTALGDVGREGLVSTGVLVMGLKIKAVGGLVLAAGAVAVWQLDWRAAEVQTVAPNDVVVEAVLPNEEVVGQRTELEPEEEPIEALAGSSAFYFESHEVSTGEPAVRPARKGRVIGLDGVGLAGVPVVFGPFGPAGIGDPVVSGPGGWFEVQDAPESGQIDAVGTEWATVFQPRVLSSRQTDLPVLVVAPAIALGGFVRDELGSPIAEAWVSIEIPEHLRSGLNAIVDESHTLEWRVRTDADGRFRFEVAPAVVGAAMTARHPLFVAAEQEAPTEDALELVIVLAGSAGKVAALTGVVVDGEGAPVAGAAVRLGQASTYADSHGAFALHLKRKDEARTLQVCARGLLPTTIEGQLGVDVEYAFPEPLVVVLDQAASKLRGRVVDPAGHPAAGVAVWTSDEEEFGSFRYDQDDPESWHLDRTVEAIARDELWGGDVETDAEGRFVLAGLQPRPYTVAAFDHGRFVFGVSAPTLPGEEAEVRLEEEAARVDVTGLVTSLAGVPIAEVEVHFKRSISYSSRVGQVDEERGGYHTKTDANGRFAIADLPVSAATLHFDGGGLASSFDREIDLEGRRHFEYALPLLCRLQVVLPNDSSATHLNVLDADGEPLAVSQKYGWVEYAHERVELDGERSEVLRTSEQAQTLVIFDGDEELLRMPLALDPNELTVVRP